MLNPVPLEGHDVPQWGGGAEPSSVVAGIWFPVAFPVSRKREQERRAAAPVIIHPILAQPPPVPRAGAAGFSFLACPAPPQSLSSAEIDEHPGNAGNPHSTCLRLSLSGWEFPAPGRSTGMAGSGTHPLPSFKASDLSYQRV